MLARWEKYYEKRDLTNLTQGLKRYYLKRKKERKKETQDNKTVKYIYIIRLDSFS